MANGHPTPKGPRFRDLTGQKFGRLTVLEYAGLNSKSACLWLCQCDCGNQKTVPTGYLTAGNTRSCGCIKRERLAGNSLSRKHGQWQSGEWQSWSGMRRRCYDPNTIGYERYGGRGITVCDRWRNSFENFLADMGPKPSPRHSIDRFPDKDGNYEPGNCRWATSTEQNRNRSSNVPLTFRGETLTCKEWAIRFGIKPNCLCWRLKAGWSVEDALTTPATTANRWHRKKA